MDCPSAGEHQAPFSENTATARTREPQARSLASAKLLSPAHPRLLRTAVNMPIRRRTAELSLQTIKSHGCVIRSHVRCQYNAAMDPYLVHMDSCQLTSAFDRKDQDLLCNSAHAPRSFRNQTNRRRDRIGSARLSRAFLSRWPVHLDGRHGVKLLQAQAGVVSMVTTGCHNLDLG